MRIIFKRPLGVVVLGTLLIVTSIFLLRHMATWDLYKQINHEWPEGIIKIRFVGSYLFRLIGLSCGVGVLLLSGFFRKLLIGLSWYSVFTLPLRHTYEAHLFFCKPLYYQQRVTMSLESFTWAATITDWLIDGIFSIVVLYYFNRPEVKKFFIKGSV